MSTTQLIRVQSVFNPWPCTVFGLRLGRAVFHPWLKNLPISYIDPAARLPFTSTPRVPIHGLRFFWRQCSVGPLGNAGRIVMTGARSDDGSRPRHGLRPWLACRVGFSGTCDTGLRSGFPCFDPRSVKSPASSYEPDDRNVPAVTRGEPCLFSNRRGTSCIVKDDHLTERSSRTARVLPRSGKSRFGRATFLVRASRFALRPVYTSSGHE